MRTNYILPATIERRVHIAFLVALLWCAGLLPVGASPARAAMSPSPQERALLALGQLESAFYDPRMGLYAITGDKYGPSASLWPTSQVLAASIAVARLTHARGDLDRVRRVIATLPRYLGRGGVYNTRAFPTRRYTDDNAWVGLDLLDAYDLLGDRAYLAQAERIFHYFEASWSPRGGGILWADGHQERVTVSNGPAATIGFRLAMITHDASYARFAERAYAWENERLRDRSGLYLDHVRADGSIDGTLRTYNQGVMIDADLAYARYTGNARYTQAAVALARAAARAFASPRRGTGSEAMFDAIYFAALSRLDARTPNAAALDPARAYLRWAWPRVSAPAARDESALLTQAAYVLTAASLAR